MITLFCIRPKGFNVGNDAIFLGMQTFLHAAFGEVVNVITLPATSRYESHAKAGLTAQTIYDINLYGDGVVIGGGNLYENGELQVDLNALSALEVPMMLFSLSRGRVYNRRNELVDRTNVMPDSVTRAINAKAQISLARDICTHNYLQQIGIEHVHVGGCPTIFLDRVGNRFPHLPVEEDSGVLISLRNPALMSIPLQKQANVRQHISEIVTFLRSEGHNNVRLLCHDHRDIPFAASFTNIEFIYLDDVYTYLALLKKCRLNITYRLHSALPCLSFGRPMIKISYDERAVSLMQTIGYGDWNIDMVQNDDVLGHVRDRYRRLDELPILKERNQSLWRSLDNSMSNSFCEFANLVRTYRKATGVQQ
ncbi:MAG: polysaccharide pyruvyl transferase family protein [Pirellulaceae bacterium]|nr:polysaccharide pyruvyl transferase family protein [Pirellulaceae bacterium]